MTVQQSRPSALMWALAVVELVAAAVVARLILWSERPQPTTPHDRVMPGMPGEPVPAGPQWG